MLRLPRLLEAWTGDVSGTLGLDNLDILLCFLFLTLLISRAPTLKIPSTL